MRRPEGVDLRVFHTMSTMVHEGLFMKNEHYESKQDQEKQGRENRRAAKSAEIIFDIKNSAFSAALR
jgi:hypothetical protein